MQNLVSPVNQGRSSWCLVCFLLLALMGCATSAQKRGAVPSEDLATTRARAEESYQNADWRTAAEAYGVLVAATSTDVDLWFRYANALARSDQSERAVLAYREVLTRDKNYAKAWFNMGIVQLRGAADSFLAMSTNVDGSDSLRSQSEQMYRDISRLLDNSISGQGAATKKPGPIAPSTASPLPLDEAQLENGLRP